VRARRGREARGAAVVRGRAVKGGQGDGAGPQAQASPSVRSSPLARPTALSPTCLHTALTAELVPACPALGDPLRGDDAEGHGSPCLPLA
jgi:hypothetical protein